jgi:very-short-patch-repair endonuclease
MRKPVKRWHTNPELWEKLKPLAHEKRFKPTEAEKKLWSYLRKHQLHGLSFRHEHCMGPFIVDFYCKKANLVIEVDGEIHQYQTEKDRIRQEFLESKKFYVLRFTNEMVLNQTEVVLGKIEQYLSNVL